MVNVTPLQTGGDGSGRANRDAYSAGRPAVGNPAHTRREDAIGTPPQRPTLVPPQRYYSAAFAAHEVERMWPKVWQVACTVDHVAEPGDYFEYRCGPYSVLIVRGDDGDPARFSERVPPPGQLAVHRLGIRPTRS